MQRSNPTSPHPSEGQHPPPPSPPPSPHQNQNQDQNQGQVNSFPSLDNHSQQNHQQYDQEGGEGQEDIEQYSDAAPPSSQLVKYGSNLPPQPPTGLIVDRVISLPPQVSFPPQQRSQYQDQQQQGNDQRFEIPTYRSSPQQQRQGPNTSPSFPTQTPVKNLFARPPLNPSPQINSSPLRTPNRPADPSGRMTTDPIATSRMKQNTTSEGTTYSLAAPLAGKQVLMRRVSRGVNAPFKVPFLDGSPGHKEKEREMDKSRVNVGGGVVEGEETERHQVQIPSRGMRADQQQDHQMLSAKKEAAQKRAQAIQVS